MLRFSNGINADLGFYLKVIRKEQRLSGIEMAKILNISQQQISRYETGKTKLTFEAMDEILKKMNRSWEDLFNNVLIKHDSDHQSDFIKSESYFYLMKLKNVR